MGRLNRLITIQDKTVTRDQYGGSIEQWVELAVVWAERIIWKPKQKFIQGSARFVNISTSSFRLLQRADLDLDETMRVLDDNAILWDIIGIVKTDRQFVTLQVGHTT